MSTKAPTFTSEDPLILEVPENTASNVNIGIVVATDPDTKATNMDWKTFTYGFKNSSDDDLFSLDAATGQLTTDAELDHEKQRDYEVIVTVSDGVANGDKAAADADDEIRVVIRVTDDTADNAAVVNNVPYFNRNEGDGLLTTRTVAENTPAGENIVPILGATEDDTGDDLTFAFDLVDNPDAASFDIDAATGQLKTKAGLNYEVKDTYSVKVTVSDGKDAAGDPDTAVDDTITVTIMVTDVNEGPMFTSADPLILTVEENTVPNVNIGSVVATDPDTKATNADWNSFTYGFKNPLRCRFYH